jgi:hypothetical protein
MDAFECIASQCGTSGDCGCAAKLRAEIERLRGLLEDACVVFDHYELPEHALHFRRALARERASE